MNVASLMTSFSTGTYTVTRTARGTTVRGKVQQGVTSTVTISASVSPATEDDIRRLPEGRLVTEARVVFSTTQLQLGGQGAAYEADVISIESTLWEVSQDERWQDSLSGSVGYRYMVLRIDT